MSYNCQVHLHLLKFYEAPCKVGSTEGGWEIEFKVICTGTSFMLGNCSVYTK